MTKIRSISRFKHSSKAFVLGVVVCFFAGALQAQDILTIDQDRLFSETQLGAETLAELERAAQELAAENNEIESSLIDEERRLTEQRSQLEAAEFRKLADGFDQRVQQLRAEQDEKARNLTRARDEARAAFFNEVAVIISEIVREKGALVVIDRRDVFLSADRIDITDEAIQRVNDAESRASE